MFLSSTLRGMFLEASLSPGSRPSAGAKGICCLRAPETPEGERGAAIAETNRASYYQHCSHAHSRFPSATFNGMLFARFNPAQAERVSAGNFPARAMKVPQGWYIARFVAAAVSSCVGRA
jgi:hypothetical protein